MPPTKHWIRAALLTAMLVLGFLTRSLEAFVPYSSRPSLHCAHNIHLCARNDNGQQPKNKSPFGVNVLRELFAKQALALSLTIGLVAVNLPPIPVLPIQITQQASAAVAPLADVGLR